MRFSLGKIVVEDDNGDINNVRLVKQAARPRRALRWNAGRKLVDFGVVQTDGGLNLEITPQWLLVVPLPDSEAFEVGLNMDELPVRSPEGVKGVTVLNKDESVGREVSYKKDGQYLRFQTRKGEFAYMIQ